MKELKPIILLAHIFFIAMIAFAAIFYVERIAYIDNSFFAFKILTFRTFDVEAYRYSEIITQLLPLLAMKLKLSLRIFLISYSVSFVLIYYIIFLINVYLFKSLKAGIAVSLVMILGISDSAFYPATEIEFGVVLCILYYGYLEYYFQNFISLTKSKISSLLLLGALIVLLCLFSHPATLIPILFILVFEIINYKLYLNKTSWFLLIFILAVYLIKLFSINMASYEGSKIEPLRNFLSLAIHLRSLYSLKFFIKYITFGIYILPVTLMLVSLIYYYTKRHYVKLFYYGFAIIGCFVFLMVAHSPGESDIGMERNMLPLWVLVAVPFAHDFLLIKISIKYLKAAFLYGLIIIISSLFFYRAVKIYTTRTVYVKEILKVASETKGGRKFVIEHKSLNMDLIMNHWSFANETLLLSSLEGKDKSKTIYLVNDINQLKSEFDFQKKDVYLSVPFWLQWSYSSLNHDYFNLPDESYIFIEDKIPFNAKPVR
jgi:hypothetical protein